jgi:hypothetical protein
MLVGNLVAAKDYKGYLIGRRLGHAIVNELALHPAMRLRLHADKGSEVARIYAALPYLLPGLVFLSAELLPNGLKISYLFERKQVVGKRFSGYDNKSRMVRSKHRVNNNRRHGFSYKNLASKRIFAGRSILNLALREQFLKRLSMLNKDNYCLDTIIEGHRQDK